jgi:MATE family multidrug resistance protein
VLGHIWRPDWTLMRQLIAIGMPISGALTLEWGLFSSAALLVGWIGSIALAAHQIALQVATILFMVPFGISLAATVRVGHAVGRRDAVAARRAGLVAIALGGAFMLPTTLVVIAARNAIPIIFLGSSGPVVVETARLAATLLLIGSSFFVCDAIQAISAGALRGLNDTRMPMLYSAVSFWLIGFTSAYALAFPLRLGAIGIWIGFSLSVITFAALLTWRFHVLTARRDLSAIALVNAVGA